MIEAKRPSNKIVKTIITIIEKSDDPLSKVNDLNETYISQRSKIETQDLSRLPNDCIETIVINGTIVVSRPDRSRAQTDPSTEIVYKRLRS